jgi:glycine/D-amino acid oxidase-like deaminating enzyme
MSATTSPTRPFAPESSARRPAARIYWRDTEPVDPGPPLSSDIDCDVCIVGAGYTGMWAAYFLKQADPALRIHILEADYAGCGASGHNDGFVTPTIGHSLHTVVRRYGPERAKAAYIAVGRSIIELRRFCAKHHIAADFEASGFYLVASNSGQVRRLEHDVRLAAQMGMNYEVTGARESQECIGSHAIRAALKTPGALVNPHKLARGLARVLKQIDVEIHERSPVEAIERVRGYHVARTARGCVRAPRMILATNAYQHQFDAFRRMVKPVWSYAAVTEPLDEELLARVHWPGREGFVEARNFIVFGRFTADNRLLIGGGPAPYLYGRDMDERHMRDDSIHQLLRDHLARYFPAWSDLRFTHAYGGCIAVTRDLLPHVGTSGNGLYYAYGYCGNGIAMTHTAGKALRDLVLERGTDYAKLPFVCDVESAFPSEPTTYLAARALSAVLGWQDRHPRIAGRQIV